MREIAPCLIDHGIRGTEVRKPETELNEGGPVPEKEHIGASSVTSFHREDWMGAPLSPAVSTGAVDLAVACSAPPSDEVRVHGLRRLARFAKVIQRRHGISPDAATLIALATLSAAAGPRRTIKNPLGGAVPATLNVAVEHAVRAPAQRAACQAVSPVQQWIARKIAANQEKGAKHLRQLRMELELDCARAADSLRCPLEKPRELLTIPIPVGERKKEALTEAVGEAERLAERLHLFEFEERPFVVADGLAAQDIPAIPQRAFDGALLNFSPGGDALRQLEAMRVAERREVLRYLVAAWHGKPFVAGTHTILHPSVTNLWLLEAGDTTRMLRNPLIAASGLAETFLMVTSDTPVDVDIESFAATAAEDDWRDLIDVVFGERIIGDACEHRLSEEAVQRFLQFHANTARDQSAGRGRFAAWWPEQVLKISLLLHLDSVHEQLPAEIDVATLEAAITIVERLGAAQLQVIATVTSPRPSVDAEIEVMVAKIRVNGPMAKWNLFRRYHVQRAEVMEPILARCCERNLLRIEGDLVRLPDAGQ